MKFFYILVLTPIVFGWDSIRYENSVEDRRPPPKRPRLEVSSMRYPKLVPGAGRNKVSDKELRAFTAKLLKKDDNNAAHYVRINYQGHTNFPPKPLVEINKKTRHIITISKLFKLYDNYICDASVNEHWTRAERAEENSLLDSFMDTPVMDFTMNFLADKGLVGRDKNALKDLLYRIWFTMYSRRGDKIGSSGFEHVFLGELKRGEVIGMHNWVFFGTEEEKKEVENVDILKKIDLGGKGAILELHYKWVGVWKYHGSMFVGTSPELEMALYTVCFLVRPDEECQVSMAGRRFSIITYPYINRQSNNRIIGSAYPKIL